MKNHEAHITETSKIKCHPQDMKAYVNMIDANTLKQVSPTNPHVSEVTPQVLGIVNSVSEVQSLEFEISKVQVSNIETSEVEVSKVHVSNIKAPKVHVSDIHVLSIQILNIHISNI